MELTLDSAFSPGGLLGNLSYVLLIASMAMRDIFWLRVLAICSGVSGIAYDLFWLSDPVGVFWESGFTAINVAQWLWLVAERRSCALTPDQAAIRLRVFPSLSELDFRRLVDAAELREVPAGEVLLRRGDVVRVLYLVLAGEAAVQRDGRAFSTCVSDDFIGEIGFTRGVPATATVVATEPMRLMIFDGAWLRAKMGDDPQFDRGFGFALNANLASKLIRRQQTSDVV